MPSRLAIHDIDDGTYLGERFAIAFANYCLRDKEQDRWVVRKLYM
jgi:hypothetical protein